MDSDKTVNYWPGFVDALANVVVTMVFVIVVFTVALLYLSQSRLKEALASAQALAASTAPVAGPPVSARIDELEQKLAQALQDNEALRAQIKARPPAALGNAPRADVLADKAPRMSPPVPAAANIDGRQSSLRVVFPAGAVELDSASLARLELAFAPIAEQAKSQGVTMVALPEEGAYSEGKRLSYYRNLALRNWLIDHGVRVDQIRMRIAEVGTEAPQAVVQISVGR